MEVKSNRVTFPLLSTPENILGKLPPEAKAWFESLPWHQRRYVLSLCYLMSAASPETQAEFLDDYTADGLVSKKLEDKETEQRVREYLKEFRINTELNATVLRRYIRQFYIHSAQDARRQPELYLESALRLVFSTEERNNVFNYILGFELLQMMFRMSWLEHERLYRLQRNQEEFINTYIKPIQHAHRVNGIIVPKDEGVFFAKRSYFVQKPEISERKLIELVMATFTTDLVSLFGFSIIRHPNSLHFEYDYIFGSEQQEAIFDCATAE
ncbi:MAG TPA: YdeI/OmpD-associated family protein [Synechococcales cyanobacterium M55_K2018_004]|nr:YdeI/OmpD-associated family protein [Synechococcales cyanobacterium M55_K2018_004]